MHSIKNLSSKTVWAQNLRRRSPPWTVFWAVLANTHPGLIRLTYSERFRGHARSWTKDLWIKGQLAVAFYSLLLRAVANCSEKSLNFVTGDPNRMKFFIQEWSLQGTCWCHRSLSHSRSAEEQRWYCVQAAAHLTIGRWRCTKLGMWKASICILLHGLVTQASNFKCS